MDNLLSPPILCFLLGAAAALLRSDLELPQPMPRVMSLYLLFAIGCKGGFALAAGALDARVLGILAVSVGLAVLTPLLVYPIARRKLGRTDAAAVAATYGSISAVTFITAIDLLDRAGIPHGGYMIAAMALMESPAIIIGVLLVRARASSGAATPGRAPAPVDWKAVGHDAFLNGSVFILLGALAIGFVTGERGRATLEPFISGLFPGVLAFFLLDMGLIAARRIRNLREAGWVAPFLGLVFPVLNAFVALGAARLLGLGVGDSLLLMILAGSASYIAVPAALRLAIPDANPALYVGMALGVTFPFNILVAMPLYLHLLQRFHGSP